MKFLLYISLMAIVCFSCETKKIITKESDRPVALTPSKEYEGLSEQAYVRPNDLPSLFKILELKDLEIVEFKRIYKHHANQIVQFNATAPDQRAKVIERKKILDSRDRSINRMLNSPQRKIYADYLYDQRKRLKENSKLGQNGKI